MRRVVVGGGGIKKGGEEAVCRVWILSVVRGAERIVNDRFSETGAYPLTGELWALGLGGGEGRCCTVTGFLGGS